MMVAREFHLGHEAEEDPFEAEETLSLCDLPTIGDSAEWDDSYSKEKEDVGDYDDDFFEFISEDYTASTTIQKDIIFCGKIISSYNESSNDAKQSYASDSSAPNRNGDNGSILLPWTPNRSTSKSAPSLDSSFRKGRESKGSRRHYSVGRVSLMRSATKSRWYLFIFGMSSMKLPAEMDLSDIRSRQRRGRVPETKTTVSTTARGEAVVGKSKKGRNSWLEKLLRSLGFGCGNTKQANDVVKSFVSMNLPSVKASTCLELAKVDPTSIERGSRSQII